MKDNQEPVDDLFIKLFSYTCRDKRSPTEDFCTEALAWCLRCSDEFRERFITEIDQTLDAKTGVTVTTQHGYKSETEDENTNTGRFDLVIQSKAVNGFAFVIESKVDSKFGDNQIGKYLSELKNGNSFEGYLPANRHLVTLTRSTSDVPASNPDRRCLKALFTWTKVHELLEEIAGKNHITKDTLSNCSSANLVLSLFAIFLKSKGMYNMKMPKILSSTSFGDSAEFCFAIQKILGQIEKIREIFSGRDAKWKSHPEDEIWIELLKGEPYFYVGFKVMPEQKLLVEADFLSEQAQKSFVFEDKNNFKCDWKNENGFGIFGDFTEEYDGNAEKIREWFSEAVRMALELRGTQKV